jgi:hypothetical protein
MEYSAPTIGRVVLKLSLFDMGELVTLTLDIKFWLWCDYLFIFTISVVLWKNAKWGWAHTSLFEMIDIIKITCSRFQLKDHLCVLLFCNEKITMMLYLLTNIISFIGERNEILPMLGLVQNQSLLLLNLTWYSSFILKRETFDDVILWNYWAFVYR